MNIEDQVCAVEQSKLLRELGINQESLFYWLKYCNKWSLVYRGKYLESYYTDCVSAFTSTEIGEILPGVIIDNEKYYILSMDCKKHIFYEEYHYKKSKLQLPDINYYDESEVNARAKMLIFLLEKGLIHNVSRANRTINKHE